MVAARLTIGALRSVIPVAGDASKLTFALDGTVLVYALVSALPSAC